MRWCTLPRRHGGGLLALDASTENNPKHPPTSPAPIPSAVDPHTVERAWFRGVKVERATVRTTLTPLGRVCSALPGSAVDGMGAPARTPTGPQSATVSPPSRCRPIPRRRHHLVPADDIPPLPACTQRAAGRGQPGRRQEAGRAVEAARARAVRGP